MEFLFFFNVKRKLEEDILGAIIVKLKCKP